jgi:hypothetical protein
VNQRIGGWLISSINRVIQNGAKGRTNVPQTCPSGGLGDEHRFFDRNDAKNWMRPRKTISLKCFAVHDFAATVY